MFLPLLVPQYLHPLRPQEILDDVIRACRIVMEINSMARVRLDVGFEIGGGNVGEALDHGGRDGWDGRIPGVETIASAVWEVVGCKNEC